jgi:hypothetical protein
MEQVMEHPSKKAYREKNKEKIYARVKAWRLKYPHRVLMNGARQRAVKRGLEFNIEAVDVEIPVSCPILDIPIIRHKCIEVRSGPHNNSPSIDRIDNTKGYTKGNIQVISHQANTMKGNASPEELIKFANWILKTYVGK